MFALVQHALQMSLNNKKSSKGMFPLQGKQAEILSMFKHALWKMQQSSVGISFSCLDIVHAWQLEEWDMNTIRSYGYSLDFYGRTYFFTL